MVSEDNPNAGGAGDISAEWPPPRPEPDPDTTQVVVATGRRKKMLEAVIEDAVTDHDTNSFHPERLMADEIIRLRKQLQDNE